MNNGWTSRTGTWNWRRRCWTSSWSLNDLFLFLFFLTLLNFLNYGFFQNWGTSWGRCTWCCDLTSGCWLDGWLSLLFNFFDYFFWHGGRTTRSRTWDWWGRGWTSCGWLCLNFLNLLFYHLFTLFLLFFLNNLLNLIDLFLFDLVFTFLGNSRWTSWSRTRHRRSVDRTTTLRSDWSFYNSFYLFLLLNDGRASRSRTWDWRRWRWATTSWLWLLFLLFHKFLNNLLNRLFLDYRRTSGAGTWNWRCGSWTSRLRLNFSNYLFLFFFFFLFLNFLYDGFFQSWGTTRSGAWYWWGRGTASCWWLWLNLLNLLFYHLFTLLLLFFLNDLFNFFNLFLFLFDLNLLSNSKWTSRSRTRHGRSVGRATTFNWSFNHCLIFHNNRYLLNFKFTLFF